MSRRVPGQDLQCHLALLRVLLHRRYHRDPSGVVDQIVYSLHQEHADLDFHRERVDLLWEDLHHAAEEHLGHPQVMPALALLQRMDLDSPEGKGLFRRNQEIFILKELQPIKISERNWAVSLGKATTWYP